MKIIKKGNALVNASYDLTLNEQRLILLGVLEAQEINESTLISIHAKDFAQRFNLDDKAAYWALREAQEQLFKREFSYQTNTERGVKHTKSRWVSKVSYVDGSGLIELRFADDVLPLIQSVKKNFSYYALEQVADLTSGYAIRLYELLIAWRSTLKMPVISLDELRLKIGVGEGKYPKLAELKRNVIDLAVKQVNEHTDIIVTYEQHKRGRSVSGFTFTFTFKKGIDRDPNTVDFIDGKTDNEKNRKRKIITKAEAGKMAKVGEDWPQLYARLSKDFIIQSP